MRTGASAARSPTHAQLMRALDAMATELRCIALQGETVLSPFERRHIGRALNAITIALHPGCYAGSDPNWMCTKKEGL